MSLIYKTLLPETINVNTYTAHKRWDILNTETGSYGIIVYTGKYITGSFNTIDSSLGDTPIEAISNGQYQHLIHRTINNLYYRSYKDVDNRYENPNTTFCYRPGQYKQLYKDLTVISIPSTIFGSKIKPNSVKITSASAIIRDDGYGNLYNSTLQYNVPDINTLLLEINFSEQYLFAPPVYVTKAPIDYICKHKVVPAAYRVKFLDSSLSNNISSSYVHFDGTGSYGNFSLEDPTDNQFIEIENSHTFDFDSDFAITFKLRVPTTQPVSESYEGDFEVDGSPISESIVGGLYTSTRRSLKQHTDNVIITKREFNNDHIPFEIAVSGSSDRNLIFRRKSKTNGELFQVTSSTLIPDTWYAVLMQKTGSNIQYSIQTDGSAFTDIVPDVANGFSTKTSTNIHIGGRPFGYKNKYYDIGLGRYIDNKRNRNIIRPAEFDLVDFRIWDAAITSDNSASFAVPVNSSAKTPINVIGNVFYEHGIITITAPSEPLATYQYQDIKNNDFQLEFNSTKEISEHIYLCQILDSEFSITQNRTILEPASSSLGVISSSFVDSDTFSPYITTIGLYNEDNELLAIGKLAQPIKKPIDYDLTVMIRFDT